MTDFNFLVPLSSTPIEGGAAYVRQLSAALADARHSVCVSGGFKHDATWIVDGLMLPYLAPNGIAGGVGLTELTGLIHHTTALVTGAERDAVRAAERERLPLLRHVIATSAPVGERLVAEFGVDPAKLTVIPPGVPDVPRSHGSGGPGCTVLSIGALVPRKGHAVLIRALQRLFDLPWRLVIIGAIRRQDHADELRAMAGDRVTFAGSLDDAALEEHWRGADLFALATEWEGHSATVAEALRRGLPVAVTRGGAAAELVTPECGVVCEPGDIDGLSKAMRRLIFDTALRAEMAEAAWHVGQTLPTWREQAEKFVAACC